MFLFSFWFVRIISFALGFLLLACPFTQLFLVCGGQFTAVSSGLVLKSLQEQDLLRVLRNLLRAQRSLLLTNNNDPTLRQLGFFRLR